MLHHPHTPPWPGALQLPDSAWIRGRGLRRLTPAGSDPDYGLYLGVGYHPAWEHQHLSWPDFWLPRDPTLAVHLLREAHAHARSGQRVEIACAGGRGRTGTALAAVAILAGIDPAHAVTWVREHYDRGAVETPWQRRWVRRFPELLV